MDLEIKALVHAHWPEVQLIYLEGLATGHATFETRAPSWERWDASHLAKPRLVAELDGSVHGWAALSPVSAREVYSGVAEVSVYVGELSRGLGIGRALLQALVAESEQSGIWTLQASIFPENESSVALHKGCGFREVGRRERIGQMNGSGATPFCSSGEVKSRTDFSLFKCEVRSAYGKRTTV